MKIKISVWGLLILSPLSFLLGLSIMIAFYSNQVSGEELQTKIADKISYILLFSQLFMSLLLYIYARQNTINLFSETFISPSKKKDIFLGVFLGTAIAFCYFKLGIAEAIIYLQRSLGDYVPPGETSVSVGKHVWIFFLANVILAPFVEENIYRNLAFRKFKKNNSGLTTVLITSVFFGLLHWMGGLWYMLSTALLIGIPFGIIQLKRNNLLLVFTAHLSLNLWEYIFSLKR